MGYATTADIAAYRQVDLGQIGDPAMWDRYLAAADRTVQQLTMATVYKHDGAGMPTDPKVLAAFAQAAAAQASWFEEIADPTGAQEVFAGSSAGNVTIRARQAAVGSDSPRIAPDTVTILRLAGLLNGFIGPG